MHKFPSITAYDDDDEEEEDVFIGDIAEQYLQKFACNSGIDKTFGLRDKDGKFYIGNKEAKIKENNIIVGDKENASTPGLWELMYIYIFIRHEDRKKNKKKHEQLSITKRIQCMIMHKQKQNYVRHFDLNTSRIRYFSELT